MLFATVRGLLAGLASNQSDLDYAKIAKRSLIVSLS